MIAVILFVVLFWGNASAFTVEDCPHSIAHDKHNQVLGDKCFRFFLDINLEYKDAQRYCKRRGGNLAMVKSKATNDFLTQHLIHTYKQDGEFWIGLNDVDDENDFEWVDGTHLGSYSNWADSDEGPRGGIKHPFRHHYEDCVAMDAGSNGKWRDFRCADFFAHAVNEHKLFICEFTLMLTTPLYPQTTTAAANKVLFSQTTVPNLLSSSSKPLVSTTRPSKTTLRPPNTPVAPSNTPVTTSNTPVAPSNTPVAPSNTPVTPSNTPVTTLGGSTSTSSDTMMTTTPNIPQPTSSSCGKLVCDLDCAMTGFETDANGCLICKCDSR